MSRNDTDTMLCERHRRRGYRIVVGLILLAAALRITFALLHSAGPLWPDGHRYVRIAQYIVAEGRFPVEERHAPPLHPLVLASVFGLVGFNGTAARVAMALFGTATCCVLYAMGKRLFGRQNGIIALLVLAVYPLHVYLSSLYEYPQTIFMFFLSVAAYQLIALSEEPQAWHRWILAGIPLGLGILTVPTLATAAPFLALWLLFASKRPWHRRALGVVVFTASCSCVVLAFSLYVYKETGRFQIGSDSGPESLFNGNCRLAWKMGKGDLADRYEIHGDPVPVEDQEAYAEYQSVMERAHAVPAGEARNAVFKQAVREFWTERPGEAILLLSRKTLLYWCPYAITVIKTGHNNTFSKAVQTLSFVPICVLGLVSVFVQRRKVKALMPIYIIVLSQWMTYSIFFPTLRYRSHSDVFLVLLAAPAIAALAARIRPAFGLKNRGGRPEDFDDAALSPAALHVSEMVPTETDR